MSPADKAARDAARDAIVRGLILRQVRRYFGDHPEAQTALLAVAQYADRESDDAVHGRVQFSHLHEPSTDALYEDEACGPYALEVVHWERNRDAIPLFAAWCPDDAEERPIVLYRREGPEVTWIAEPIRPELDGVEPLPAKNVLDPATVRAMRDGLVHGSIREQVRWVFRDRPTLRSAYLVVSQYWSDEADDAVHGLLLFSQLPEPSIDGWRADEDWLDENWKSNAELAAAGKAPLSDNVRGIPLPSDSSAFNLWSLGAVLVDRWDANGDAIPLFAAWCAEGSDQEMPHSEAYRPIVLYQRAGDDVTVTWIAEPLRPWLDGVQPIDSDDDL